MKCSMIVCSFEHVSNNSLHHFSFDDFFLKNSYYGKHVDLLCVLFFLCRRGKKHFDFHFYRIKPVHFPPKDGKHAAYEGKNGWNSVYFLPESAFCPL